MTHEHLDHVQGLLAAKRAGVELAARHAWLTGSAHPDYYDNHPDAKAKKRSLELALEDAHRIVQAAPGPVAGDDGPQQLDDAAAGCARTRGPATTSTTCARIAPPDQTHYVDRTTDLDGKHPFGEATLRDAGAGGGHVVVLRSPWADPHCRGPPRAAPPPPERRRSACPSRRWASSPAPSSTSRSRDARARAARSWRSTRPTTTPAWCLQLEWRGWRLLFAGDAELEVVEDDARERARAGALREDLAPRQPQRDVRRAVRRADAAEEPATGETGTRSCPRTTVTGTACRTSTGPCRSTRCRAAPCTTPAPSRLGESLEIRFPG